MRTLLLKIGINIDEPSTKKGIALIGSGAALAMGHPELLHASITESGVQHGGLIGTAVPVALGIWETIRKEF
ncbi:hypothetical protein BA953_16620 [Vibrio coralliilyticus]|uniref:hypothetical protein n=1 Tax=Vibrio coralliilyticus TaxID=190893 RepID=UPI0008106B1E|nr:hypothetical protein [Vibrio coralliilyticus]ANW25820.1 hypothetical protein BA953_16620 [Vibrio coralliilyticus]